MTVKQLKKILKDWPEIKENGEPAEVWLEVGWMLNSKAVNHGRLGDGDLLLGIKQFEDNIEE